MSKFKVGQTYKTRNVSIARIYATDGYKFHEIHGATYSDEDGWDSLTSNKQGRFFKTDEDSAWDLMPEIEYWYMLVYIHHTVKKECSLLFNSDEERHEWIDKSSTFKIVKTFEVEKP